MILGDPPLPECPELEFGHVTLLSALSLIMTTVLFEDGKTETQPPNCKAFNKVKIQNHALITAENGSAPQLQLSLHCLPTPQLFWGRRVSAPLAT